MAYLATMRKALVSAVGIGLVLLANNLVPEQYVSFVSAGIGVLGVFGVYYVPNAAAAVVEE